MTADAFRTLALSLPETVESAHMNHPDFRARDKIFATLWHDDAWGMIKLTPEDQQRFVLADPAVYQPLKGAWGRRGATRVCLQAATKDTLRQALVAAWCNTAPKKLVEQFDLE
jgi:hypothetical protein